MVFQGVGRRSMAACGVERRSMPGAGAPADDASEHAAEPDACKHGEQGRQPACSAALKGNTNEITEITS